MACALSCVGTAVQAASGRRTRPRSRSLRHPAGHHDHAGGGVLMTATRQLQGRGEPFSGGGRSVEEFVQQLVERIFSRPPSPRRCVEMD